MRLVLLSASLRSSAALPFSFIPSSIRFQPLALALALAFPGQVIGAWMPAKLALATLRHGEPTQQECAAVPER
jgi:hypothetical protein